jgi:hypothetical protein
MQRTLNQLLKDAMERKPRRLSFDTCWNYFEAVVYNLGDLMYLSRLKLLTLFNLVRLNYVS